MIAEALAFIYIATLICILMPVLLLGTVKYTLWLGKVLGLWQ